MNMDQLAQGGGRGLASTGRDLNERSQNHDHFPLGLIRFHDAMGLLNIFEAEDARPLPLGGNSREGAFHKKLTEDAGSPTR
jgi:hypothetical protein